MKFSVVSLAVIYVAFLLATPISARDYKMEISQDVTTNSVFVSKNSAQGHYKGTIHYEGRGTSCAWKFCITRSFRGLVTDINSVDTDGDNDRILTENEGCLLVHQDNVTFPEGPVQFAGALDTDPFAWNAEGEFYMNGQLLSGQCFVSMIITGDECQEDSQFGFECLPSSSYPIPNETEHLSSEGNPLVFGLDTHHLSNRLGQLKMVIDARQDYESDGLGTDFGEESASGDLGTVRLLLDGIPTAEDYDFEVPLVGPQTELFLAAARPNSNYFYSVKASKEVAVRVESVSVDVCSGASGPNCSITGKSLGQSVVGEVQTFNPNEETFCYGDICYFSLVQKNFLVTIKPVDMNDDVGVIYKTKNFPTENDFDVAMPGGTTFLPDALQTESTAYFAVVVPSGNPFTVLLGTAPTPPPPPPPSDDELPWAWIGVAIALGVISLALIIGFAVYTCKSGRSYESIE